MPATGELGIKVAVDDSELQKLLASIASLAAQMGGSTARAMQAIVASTKSATEQVQSISADSGERLKAIRQSVTQKNVEAIAKEEQTDAQSKAREIEMAYKAANDEAAAEATALAKETQEYQKANEIRRSQIEGLFQVKESLEQRGAEKTEALTAKEIAAYEKARAQEEASAQKAAAKEEAARAKALEKEQQLLKQKEEAEENANKIIAEQSQRYAKLKEEYEGRSLDDVRAKIMQFEEETRVLRNARAQSEDQATKKEIQERVNAVNTELQLYRSLEKEKIGRTFSEQMERLNLEEKSNRQIKEILEQQKEEFKEIQQQMTITQDAEEKKRLAGELSTLKSENAAVKKAAEERGIEEENGSKKEGGKKEGGGLVGGLVEGAGIGAGIEGLKMLAEHAKDANNAQEQLKAGTGLAGEALQKQGEEAEKLGEKYAISGDAAKGIAGTISAATGATGEALNTQTESILAYATVHKRADQTVEEAVSKLTKTYGTNAAIRAQIDSESAQNQAKAATIMNDPAMQMQKAQAQLMDTIGKVAAVVMNALTPALAAVSPVLDALSGIVSSTLAPLFEQLQPALTAISASFKEIAPVISTLIGSALSALAPILGVITNTIKTLLPPIISIVKTISEKLSPVFQELAPLIQQLATIIAEQMTAGLQILLPVISALLPPLIDALMPILKALIPVITQIAGLFSGVLQIAIKAISDVLIWIVNNAIAPLIKWLSGGLTKAVQDVVGVITKAVGAITSIVSSVKGFLGLGDDAAAAAKDAANKTLAEQKKTQEKSVAQSEEFSLAEISQLKFAATNHSLAQEDIDAARIRAQHTHNDQVLHILDQAQKQQAGAVAKSARAAHSAAAKEAKDYFAQAKADLDNALAEQKDDIETRNQQGLLSDRKAKDAQLAAQKDHDEKMVALLEDLHTKKKIADTAYNTKVTALNRAVQKDQAAINKESQAGALADLKEAGDRKIAELELQAVRENMTASLLAVKKTQIERDTLAEELTLRKQHGEDVAKLELQLATMDATIAANTIKARMALMKSALEQQRIIDSDEMTALQNKAAREQALGRSTAEEEMQIRALASKQQEEQENDRYAQELEQRKSELDENALLLKGDIDGAKLAHQIKESMEQDHLNKMRAIKQNAVTADEQAFQKEKQLAATHIAALQDLFNTGSQGKLKIAQDYGVKVLGIEGAQYIGQHNGLTQFLATSLKQIAAGKATELVTWVSTEYQKTAATNSGVLARSAAVAKEVALGAWSVAQKIGQTAILIAQNVAGAAASAFNATVSAIRWVAESIPFPLDLALIPVAVAGIYEAYTGARKLFKFAEGAVLTQPTNFGFGSAHGQAGEAGHEAIIPLVKYPGMKHLMEHDGGVSSGLGQALAPVVAGLQAVHNAVQTSNTTFAQRQPASILSPYGTKLSVQQETLLVNQRKLGR